MIEITLDFETHYGADYTLSKMTTPEDIRDPQFKVHGVGLQIGTGPRVWVEGGNAAAALGGLPWDDVALIGHNLMFDGAILAWRYGVRPKQYRDTLGMSRAIIGTKLRKHGLHDVSQHLGLAGKVGYDHGEAVALAAIKDNRDPSPAELAALGHYCAGAPNSDIALTRAVYDALKPHMPDGEWGILDWTIRAFTTPMLELDEEKLRLYRDEVMLGKTKLCRDLGIPRTEIVSNDQFAAHLRARGVKPPMKFSPQTRKQTYAFAKGDFDFTQLAAEHPDAFVRALVEARLEVKSSIEETRAVKLLGIARTGSLPVPLAYSGAMNSHRLSGCLVADTQILVVDRIVGMCYKAIVDVLPDDLVWDGDEFVSHGGVKFSGYREVVEWDGVTATPEHVVFTESGAEVPISSAAGTGDRIKSCRLPTPHEVAVARGVADSM